MGISKKTKAFKAKINRFKKAIGEAADSKWDGLSLGAGISIKKFKFGVSYSKLHVSSNSLLFNASYTL